MKPQTKHALVGLAVTIGLLALFIWMERNMDGVTTSMKIIMAFMAVSGFYTFINGITANAVQRKNVSGPFIRHRAEIEKPPELDQLHKEAQNLIDRFKK